MSLEAVNQWLSEHVLELTIALVSGFLTAGFHFVWWMATTSEKLKQAEKDINGVADVVGTERAKARRKDYPPRSK